MSFKEIELYLIKLNEEFSREKETHEEFVRNNRANYNEAVRQKGMVLKGFDIEKVKMAESVLAIYGLKNEYDQSPVNQAIKDIAQGCETISKMYFGVKNYSGYVHQGCNCEYGYGPTHGSIVFSVGLKNPKIPLTEEQVECCLYYLNAIKNNDARAAITGGNTN
jgi:hypothetical protein